MLHARHVGGVSLGKEMSNFHLDLNTCTIQSEESVYHTQVLQLALMSL